MTAVERAHQDIERGDYGMARVRLASYLNSRGYDAEILERLGRISFEMHDLAQAGRYWLASSAEGPQVEAAVSSFVRYSGGDARITVSQLPKAVREAPMSAFPEIAKERLRRLKLEESLSSWDAARPQGSASGLGRGEKAIILLLCVGLIALFGLMGVGAWTVIDWLVG